MAEYNPSKIVKDGNTYNFRDTTKIPLAGSNAISGSLIPATTNAYNLGSSSYQWNNAYIKSLTINGTACGDILTHNASEFVPRSGGAVLNGQSYARNVDNESLLFIGGTAYNLGAYIELYGKNHSSRGGQITLSCRKSDGTPMSLLLYPDGTATWGSKNVAMQEDTVPRSGGAVITGRVIGRTVNDSELILQSGSTWDKGAGIGIYGAESPSAPGCVKLQARTSSTVAKDMALYPDGTWTWQGSAVQLISDQRYKQQINQIDDKLLDAWEDVELSQFKYNDAVKEKSDNARLHTGYVVQQIDNACKSHGVDISEYGLYCHEEYPQETEEVEVEQADGTKTKERKVIRETSEHYSLRYTEALIVECAFLRKKLKELTARIEQLESSK